MKNESVDLYICCGDLICCSNTIIGNWVYRNFKDITSDNKIATIEGDEYNYCFPFWMLNEYNSNKNEVMYEVRNGVLKKIKQ